MDEIQLRLEQSNYILKHRIGSGAFSEVYSAVHRPTFRDVAIKVVPKKNVPENTFQREILLLKLIDHPFCNGFYESFDDEIRWYVVIELLPCRTLLSEINKDSGLTESMCLHIFCQIICAIDYLHKELRIVHRDLKAENIMLDRNGNIRIIDFGLSNNFVGGENLLRTACGSPAYAPPEMLRGKEYTEAADLWSTGVVLFAMVHGRLPFYDQNVQKMVQKIVFSDPCIAPTTSAELTNLILRLLEKDQRRRITIPEVYQHPWFLKYQYADFMNSDFGLSNRWYVPKGSIPVINPKIVDELQKLGLPSDSICQSYVNGVYDGETAPYRILNREYMTDSINLFFDDSVYEPIKRRKSFTIQVPRPVSVVRRNKALIPAIHPVSPSPLMRQIPFVKESNNRRRAASNADAVFSGSGISQIRDEYKSKQKKQEIIHNEAPLPSLPRSLASSKCQNLTCIGFSVQ